MSALSANDKGTTDKDHPGVAYRLSMPLRVRALFSKIRRRTPIDLIHQMNPVVGGLSLLLRNLGYPLLLGPIWPLWRRDGPNPAKGDDLSATIKDRLLAPHFLRVDGVLTPTPASAEPFA